jgi:hypothetical protein
MVGDLHGMIIPFVDLASTFNYIEAVKQKQPISTQAYADALNHAITHVLRLRTVMPPPYEPFFSIYGFRRWYNTNKKDPPRRPQISVTPETPTLASRPAAARPNSALSAAQIKDLKAKGIVEFKGRGKPPVANDIWVDNTRTKKKSMLCSNFVTLGYYCRFGKECRFFHFRSLKD